MREIRIKIFVDFLQFYIQDEKAEGDLVGKWTEKANDLLLATTDGIIGVGTIRNMYVPVTIKVFDIEPAFFSDEESVVGQINECNINVSSGKIAILGCTDDVQDAEKIELENGIYRARIYYGNLDKINEDGLDGEDFYEVHLWKTDKEEDIKIIKNRSTST